MILVDFSPVIISSLYQLTKGMKPEADGVIYFDENQLRLAMLERLKGINLLFNKTHGQIVLALDDKRKRYWRKEIFPNYKGHRKTDTTVDWKTVYKILNEVAEGVRDYFPWKVVDVPKAEADDIIAVLTKEHHGQEPIMIISPDGDFKQLQKFPNVKQTDLIRAKEIREGNPIPYLREKIIRGDRKDGVSCILNDINDVVNGVRQKPLTAIKVNQWRELEPEFWCTDDQLLSRYRENERLLSFEYIPPDIKNAIIDKYTNNGTPKGSVYQYFVKHQLFHLLDEMNKFT